MVNHGNGPPFWQIKKRSLLRILPPTCGIARNARLFGMRDWWTPFILRANRIGTAVTPPPWWTLVGECAYAPDAG